MSDGFADSGYDGSRTDTNQGGYGGVDPSVDQSGGYGGGDPSAQGGGYDTQAVSDTGAGGYGQQDVSNVGGNVDSSYGNQDPTQAQQTLDGIQKDQSGATDWGRAEDAGGVAALAGGAVAAYEKHEASVDPADKGRDNIYGDIAAGVAAGGAGLGLVGHHEKEQDQQNQEQLENPDQPKKTGWF